MSTTLPLGANDVLISHGSPQQLADALVAKLSPKEDLRCTRDTFSEGELDRVELSLITVSRSLNSIRNAFTPINSLPRETLAMVFSMLSEPSTSTPTNDTFLPDFRKPTQEPAHAWTVVTHVCRYWRDTALAFPFLWTYIDTSCPLAALAHLSRASTSPLHVYLRDAVLHSSIRPSLERGRFLQTVAAHCAELKELHVQPTFRYGPAILRFFDHAAPQLEALSIALGTGEDQDKTLPLLFAGETPRLARLTLFNFARWHDTWDVGATLSHLCLYDQPLRARLPMDSFLRLLGGCKRLEELVVIDAGPSAVHSSGIIPMSEVSSHALLDIPNLRLLHIGNWGSPRIVSEFFSHVMLPDTTTVHIWGDVLFHSNETLFSLLPTNLSNLRLLHNLKAIHLMYRPTLRDAPQLFSVADGVLVIHFYYIASTSSELLDSVFSLLDVRNVQELTIGVDCDPDLSPGWWKNTFAAMPKLAKLNIIRRRSRAILSALTTDCERRASAPIAGTSASTADEPAQVPCPALSSLVITDDSALASIRLFALAQERATLGIPIQSLTIVNATPGLGYTALDAKMREEMEDLRCHIEDVRFSKDDVHHMPALPAGWPSAPFLWAMQRKDAKGTSHRTT